MRVLFVGTENVCVSPMAAALLYHERRQRNIDDLTIASAGLGLAGQPVVEPIAAVLADRGIDISRKRSRTVDAGLVEPADLVLTTTGAVASRLASRFPDASARVLPLRTFTRLVASRPQGLAVSSWARRQAEAVLLMADNQPADDLLRPRLDDRLGMLEAFDHVMHSVAELVAAGWPQSAAGSLSR